MATILDVGTEQFNASQSPCHPLPPIKFRLNLTYGLGGDLKNFRVDDMVAILDIGT